MKTRAGTGKDMTALCNYGVVLAELGRRDEALAVLKQAEGAFTQHNSRHPNLEFYSQVLADFRKKLSM
jgi:hypothetical protein